MIRSYWQKRFLGLGLKIIRFGTDWKKFVWVAGFALMFALFVIVFPWRTKLSLMIQPVIAAVIGTLAY